MRLQNIITHMPDLTKSDLKTHLYQEVIDEIIRAYESIAQDAIASAIDMAKSYLSRYDLVALFGSGSAEPTVSSPVLRRHVKDLACWYVLTLGNPNVELALFEKISDNAMRWLRDVQRGMSNPDWPYRDTSAMPTPPDGDSIAFSSNPKRSNHW